MKQTLVQHGKDTVKELLPLAAYVLACLALAVLGQTGLPVGLAWNVFLAYLPLKFVQWALLATRFKRFVLLCLWLLFLPNTFYFITDLVHTPRQMEWLAVLENGAARVQHSQSLADWALLVIIAAGVFICVLLGLEALYLFYGFVHTQKPALYAWAWVVAVSALCGVGMYMGRFLRLNSWDILHPRSLLQSLAANLNWFALQIIAMFAATVFVLFVFYRTIRERPARQRAVTGAKEGGQPQ